MFIEPLFSIAKQTKCASVDECIKRICDIYIYILIDIYTHTRNIIRTEKDKYCVVSFICEIKKKANS